MSTTSVRLLKIDVEWGSLTQSNIRPPQGGFVVSGDWKTDHDEMIDPDISAAKSLLAGFLLEAEIQRDTGRHNHLSALRTLRDNPDLPDTHSDTLLEQVSLTSAYVTAVVCALYDDHLLKVRPHFSITERARSALVMGGGSDPQSFLTYREMAEIATLTCMFDPQRRRRLSDGDVDGIRALVEAAMCDAEVNAGYLEATGFFVNDH